MTAATRRTRRTAAALTLAAWLCLALFLAARLLSDRTALAQWLWWTPAWAWPLAALILLLLARRTRRPRTPARAAPAIASLLALALILAADWRIHRALAPPPPDDRAVRVIFWNLAAERIPDIDHAALPRADAYIIANAASTTRLDALADSFDTPPHVSRAWPFTVVSRWPVSRLASSALHWPDQPDPPADRGRAAAFRIDATPAGDIVLWAIDLPSDPRLSRAAVARAAAATTADPRLDFPLPDLVIGDFNITRGSASLRLFAREAGVTLLDAHTQAGHGPAGTWPRQAPIWPIDLALTGPRLRALAFRTADPGVAGHRAIVVDLAPASPQPQP